MSRSRKSKRRGRADTPESTPATEPATSEPAPAITTRDVSPAGETTLDGDAWPQRAFPSIAGERGSGFAVVVRRSVLNAVHRHGQSSNDVEVCGVLVGNVYRDPTGPWLLIDASIRGDHAGSANSQVTFTAETWQHVQGVMEAQHPDQKIVGWYHTHPNFGIFLSDMDLFIHGNFFNAPWQVAFVYDPHSQEEGVFLWRDGKVERGTYLVDEDAEKEVVTVTASPEITAAALADFSRRLQGIERRQRRMAVALPFLVALAVAWPFVLYTIMVEHRATTHRIGEDEQGTAPPVAAVPTSPSVNPTAVGSSTPHLPTTEDSAAPFTRLLTPRDLTTGVYVTPTVQPGRPESYAPPATTEVTKPQATTNATRTTAPASATEPKPELIRPGPTTSGVKVLEGPSEQPPPQSKNPE